MLPMPMMGSMGAPGSGARGLGPEMALSSSVSGVPAGGPALTTYPIANALTVGALYQVTATIVGYTGTLSLGFTGGAGVEAFAAIAIGSRTRSGIGVIQFTGTAQMPNQSLFTRNENTADFTNISIREVL